MHSKFLFLGLSALVLSSCKNPFFESSSADPRFSPGWKQAASQSWTWTLNSSQQSEYSFSPSELTLDNSGASLLPRNVDKDNTLWGFGGGTLHDIEWTGSNQLELNSAGKTVGAGTYISRFFEADSSIPWTKLSVTTPFPLGKPYPGNREVETNYAPYNLDMTGNVLLLHMDETNWSGTAGEVVDASGTGNHGTAVNGGTTVSSGRFRRAASFSNGQYIQINNSSSLDITAAITLEAWVYPTVVDWGLHAIISKRNGYQTDSAYALFILSNNVFVDLGDSRFAPSGSITWQANRWYHIVATYDPANSHEWKIYLNNVVEAQTNGAPNSYVSTTSPLHIGAHVNDPNAFQGKIDEVAIYNRALTASEVAARYHRGILRLELQARSCQTQSDCLVQPFLGPDGTADTFFSEYQSSYTTPLTEFNLSGFSGKYFQYQASMTTDAGSNLSPVLQAVTVTPTVYSLTTSVISANTGFEYKTLTDFTATFTGAAKFQLGKDGQWFYWDGSTWSQASLGGPTNTVAEIKQNITSFPSVVGEGSLFFRAFLSSGNGTQNASLSSVSVSGTR